jgi:hypothetical protein
MKRIDIQWNTVKYSLGAKKRLQEISGIATILEGKDMISMEPTHSFRVTRNSKGVTRLFQINSKPLPELTDVENDIMRTMISSFYAGITKKGYCYHWLERE